MATVLYFTPTFIAGHLMSAKKPVSLASTVKPHEATKLALIAPDPVFDDAMQAVAIACNGFAYQGGDIDAQLRMVRFLRTRPDVATALGLSAA
jgi:hypothetical protein